MSKITLHINPPKKTFTFTKSLCLPSNCPLHSLINFGEWVLKIVGEHMVNPVSIEVATAVAKVLAQWVTSRALDEVSLGRDFKNQLEKLNKKFGYIQAFLDDVSRNYSANNSKKSSLVNLWLQDVKDAAYKADDVMDEYAVEIFRRRIEARNPMEEFFNNFFKPFNHVLFHFNMAHKVKDILSLLDEVNKDAHDIGLNKVDLAASSSGTQSHHDDHHLSRTRQLAIVNASDYVGRGIHQEKLLDFICCPPDEPHLSTVTIVGMGGVGKTTLTRHLYDHERVYTDSKIWICVSLGFDVGSLLNAMVDSFTSSKSELDINVAVIKLRENLNGKKLLLVLDDAWNDDHDSWKCLKEWLYRTGIVRGSVILINTRSDQVVKAARAEFNCKLRGLSKAKSWSLLHQRVFNNSISSIDSSMEEVGKRIVEKCKGVPLAIKVIGDLLQSKPHLHEWETIEKSELWDLPCGQTQIFPSLLLSFNSLLSSSVKQCFAYCAVLPKGFLMSKIELIGLWLSQGYIREEIGEETLEILLSHSLLECVSMGQGNVGYKMHDLLYGLAVFVCGRDLIKEIKGPGEIDNCRHLIISSMGDTAMADLPPQMTLPKLRTLGLKGGIITLNKIHAIHLRTLFLNQSGIAEVPPAIALLKHLRYLDLSFNPISTLPESMGKLYQLQTLIIQGTKVKTLPRVLYTLVNLRNLPTTGLVFELEESQPLTGPSSLSCHSEDEDIDAYIDALANEDDDEDKDENEETVECVIDKKLSLKCVEDSELMGISLEGVKDEITSKSFEGVEEEEMAGKSFEGAKDKELAENSLECVKGSELVGKSHEVAVNKDVVGKNLECVKDKEIAGYGLEGVKDKEIAGKSLEAVEDEEYGVAWRNKVNNSWVDGTGLQQLTNLGKIKGELQITGLECVKHMEKARKVGLAGKANITMLKLFWTEGRGETSGGVWDEDVLEALEPQPNITSLEVHNFLGVKFPPWIMEMINWTRFVNLTEVKLLNCSRCRTLPTLGHLPLLRCLFLSGFDVETIGDEFYGYYDSDLSEKLLPNSRRDIMSIFRQAGWLPQEMSFRRLIELDISGFCRLTAWNEPPQAAFPYLETLRIRDCSRLESVPFLSSKTLKVLEFRNVDRVRSLDIIKFNRRLTSLILEGLPNLESLPEELSYCTKLQKLEVYGAHKLLRMPNGLKSLVNLQAMTVVDCKVINFVMDDLLHARSSLVSFLISRCPMLIKIPSGLQECTSLRGLLLDDSHLLNEGSPINISKFQRLSFLGISCSSAEHLRSVLGSARLHKVVEHVLIEGFKNEVEMEAYFSDISPFFYLLSLRELTLVGHPNIKTLPRQLHQLTQIKRLCIHGFEDLEAIPAWICNLFSLRYLKLSNCENLEYLPSKKNLKHLFYLDISGCPMLTKRYAKDGGREWQNISHIPRIEFDSVVIQE